MSELSFDIFVLGFVQSCCYFVEKDHSENNAFTLDQLEFI